MKINILTLLYVFTLIGLANNQADAQQTATKGNYVMVVHGGAGTILKENMTPEKEKAYITVLTQALKTGYDLLKSGKSSLDAVEATVRIMEDSPLFNAGKGAVFTNEGKNELDAAIMDGKTLAAGSIAGVTTILNPISAARAVMEKSEHVMMVGAGAEKFAKETGLEIVNPKYFWTEERWNDLQKHKKAEARKFGSDKADKKSMKLGTLNNDHKFGTVGAVALDNRGRLAAATSTGGRGFEYPYRVSDSPTSAGNFANGVGAVSATGIGEQIVEFSAASTICAYLERGQSLNQAVAHLLKQARKAKAEFGFTALDSRGRYLPATTTPALIWAAATNDKFEFMRDTKTTYR